jgi:prepilin-type N-terminal cleavage/methylation domain-containing protein
MTVRNARGMTMIEVFIVMVVMGILVLSSVPRIGRTFRSSRVDRAAGLVALTLERSFTLATGTLYQRRGFGPETEYQLDSLNLSEASVTVSPTGVATLPLTVTIASGQANRQITMSSAGLVRVVR